MNRRVVIILICISSFTYAYKKTRQISGPDFYDALQYDCYETFPEKENFSGKKYYDSILEKAAKRHWAFKTAFYAVEENGGFNCDGCSVPLASNVFGKDTITIQDIYLFSKLSNDNKVRINNCTARAPVRGSVPIGATGVPFGGFRDDLYTTLLAPVELLFDADQSEVSFVLTGMRRFDCGRLNQGAITIGFEVPFKSKKHSLELSCIGGELFRSAFVPDTTQRETSLSQFYREYVDIPDFINTAILAPKCLTLDNVQQVSGLGDISLFGSVEYIDDYIFELGASIIFPTAAKGKGLTVWEPILGNGGAFQIAPFVQFLWYSSSPYLNPFMRIAVEYSFKNSTDTTRAPTLISQTKVVRTQAKNIEGLSYPETFKCFYVDAFSEYDTSIPLFGGKTPCMTEKMGTKLLFGFGNYAYQLFHIDLRFGLFYDYYHKTSDTFEVKVSENDCDCPVLCIDKESLEKCTDQTAHQISANLVYKFSNMFELGFGGQFTVLGKNVPKQHTAYISFVAVF